MKNSYFNTINAGLFCAAALLISTFAQSTLAADKAGGEARLTITRSPKLGSSTMISVMVDGKKVATLGSGKKYDGSVPAGKHTVAVRFEPSGGAEKPATMDIDASSGQTYSYSATIKSGAIAFVKNR